MAVKTITVTEEAYRRLRSRKGQTESFSELIVRLTDRPPLASFAGTLTVDEARSLRQAISSDRARRSVEDKQHAHRYQLRH